MSTLSGTTQSTELKLFPANLAYIQSPDCGFTVTDTKYDIDLTSAEATIATIDWIKGDAKSTPDAVNLIVAKTADYNGEIGENGVTVTLTLKTTIDYTDLSGSIGSKEFRQDFSFTLTDGPCGFATFAALADGTYEQNFGTIYITQTNVEISPSSIIDAIKPIVSGVTGGCSLEYSTVIEYETVAVDTATVTSRIDSYVTIGAEYNYGVDKYNTVSVKDNFLFFPDLGSYDITTTVTIAG